MQAQRSYAFILENGAFANIYTSCSNAVDTPNGQTTANHNGGLKDIGFK
jgi:hypothetical protein